MKRLLPLVLCFLLLVSCGSSAVITEPAPTGERIAAPLFYRVTDQDGDVVWLLGSIHYGDEQMWPLGDYIMDAFDASDALALELNPAAADVGQSAQAMTKMMYSDTSKIDEHISPELYEKAVELLKEGGLYSELFDYYKPSYWFMLLSAASAKEGGLNETLGVDMVLADKATACEKKILEIEGFVEQTEMLAGFSEELQLLLLEEAVEGFESSTETTRTLLEAWKNGTIAEVLAEEANEEIPEDKAELLEEYRRKMEDERNDKMADFAEDALERGEKVFICVGAVHVVGKGGMVEELTARGYTVEDMRPAA